MPAQLHAEETGARSRRARFGPFEFDLDSFELLRDREPVALAPQPAQVLALLVQRCGQVVTRDELADAVWGDTVHVDVSQSLHSCIKQVRAALGEGADEPHCLRTFPRRGYRFDAPVEWVSSPSTRSRAVRPWHVGLAAMAILGMALGVVLARAPRPTVEVIDFQVLGTDSGARQLRDALGHELKVALGREVGAGFRLVQPLASGPRSEGPLADAACWQLHGSVQRTGDSVRVTARIVRRNDGEILWSDAFDGTGVDGVDGSELALVIAAAVSRTVRDGAP